MSRISLRAALGVLLMTGVASRLPAQADPEFVVSVNPSIVTITQGSMASLTVHIAVNERPSFDFSLSGLPAGVIPQIPTAHAGANTIVLTALPTAATGSFNVALTAVASGFEPPRSGNSSQTQGFILNVKPLPLTQWEYRMERAPTERELESAAEALGQQSWELVSVVYRERGSNGLPEWTAFFKRQKHPHE